MITKGEQLTEIQQSIAELESSIRAAQCQLVAQQLHARRLERELQPNCPFCGSDGKRVKDGNYLCHQMYGRCGITRQYANIQGRVMANFYKTRFNGDGEFVPDQMFWNRETGRILHSTDFLVVQCPLKERVIIVRCDDARGIVDDLIIRGSEE